MGADEEAAADFIREDVTKPVVAYIAGVTAPPGKRMGHAGAIVSGGKGTAADKFAALERARVRTVKSPADLGKAIVEQLAKKGSKKSVAVSAKAGKARTPVKKAAADEEGHHEHAHGDRVKLTDQARKNLKLVVKPVAVRQDYWRTIQVPGVIVDQHFLQRSRENRLFGLVLAHPGELGVGIDEDAAILVSKQTAEVVGGPVMLVDGREKPGSLVVRLVPAGQSFPLPRR